ncbi:hypothetical protein SAMN02745121_00004 [Nannocystis exedens]|uniref:Uncharacterized protein n=1 Tax=Nannocystis exedens TaxID=54 RepID=A0A1I1SQG3_9BACT|nr:hypothetical protein [Nannocystis exedens]PCC75465.1 hypothetical protein NAEX_08575 [Nannocystis exedens]SFD45300.1 hypothetical protein SAMN02745121_00004 [Nannocystis exedens]
MSGRVYETLYEFSRTLSDDHIDEDLSQIELPNNRTIQCQVVHVRGKLDGRPVVVSYHSHYFVATRGYYYIPNLLEVFVAGNHLKFEGECRARGFLDKAARWFGGGGRRGPDPIFDARRIDAPRDADLTDFARPDFTARLAALSGHPLCVKVQVQAGTGINALFHGIPFRGSLPQLQAVVRDVAALAAT